ncbi:MAG: tetratricopeptide repeat protein [Chitinophagales bacterium]|nr:tetratricopeptide repeat protein [Chitinophagales bacterium]
MSKSRALFASLVAIVFFMLVFAYSNHWHNGFHFDDSHTVQNNLYVRHIQNIPLFFKDCTTFSSIPSHGSYRPLVTTSLAIDYKLGEVFSANGYDPFWYHVSTFIFFLLQAVLMWFFFKKILDTVSRGTPNAFVALFAVAWYALNPVMAETINYVISRSDSLSTFFVVLAFVVYQYAASARKYYLYLIPILIGALAKPTAIMFGPMLMAYHLLFEQEQSLLAVGKWQWNKLWKVALPSMAVFVAVYFFIKKMEAGMFEPGGSSLFEYIITQPYIYLHYVAMFLLPMQLSADTDWSTFKSLSDVGALVGFVFLILLVFTVFITSKNPKQRPITFGILWFLFALVPTTFVPLAEVMNDHRQFYPHVGTALALTWALYLVLENVWKRIPVNAIVLGSLLLFSAYAYGTYERNKVWLTEETLWKDVTEKSPLNGRGLMNYGLALMARGDYAGAEQYFKRGLELWPYYSYLYINMAIAKESTGKIDEAGYYYQKGLEYGKSYPNNYYYYGKYLYRKGSKEEAIGYLQQCLKMSSAQVDARYLLMDALYETKRLEELKSICTETLKILPSDKKATDYLAMAETGKSRAEVLETSLQEKPTAEGYLNLSLSYYQAEKYDLCITAAEKALALKPDYAEAWNNICSAHNALGNFKAGAAACEEALKLKPDYALAKNNLLWAKHNLK